MPVTAEFLADFSSFERGTKEAATALEGLEGKTADFSKEFTDAFAGADIKKLLSDPVGGATTAMEGLIGTLSPFAQGAIALAGSVAVVGGAAYKLASWSAEAAANLGDLADKTGITVPSLSRLSDAADVAGTDIGALSNVVYEMQKRMGEHPTAFATALNEIGLEFRSFKELKPEQQLLAIADGLQKQLDPVERLQTGNALLGKQYKEMAPSLYDLADAMALTAGIDPLTEADAAAAEQFKMEVAALTLQLKALAREIGLTIIPAFNDFFKALRDPDGVLAGFLAGWRTTKEVLGFVGDAMGLVTGDFVSMGPPVAGADAAVDQFNQTVEANALQMPDAAEGLKRLAEMAKEDEKAMRAAEAEEKKFTAAMIELEAAGKGWEGTLAGINGEVVAAVKYYLEAGVAQGTLATAYGLTDGQIRAVAASLKAEQDTLKETTRLETDRATSLQQLWVDYDTAVRASSDRTTQSRIDDAWRAADAQILAMAQAQTLTEEAYAVIQATATRTAENIAREALTQDEYSRAHYEQLATRAQTAYDQAKAASGQYTEARLEQLRREAEAAQTTLENWETAADAALTGITGAAEQATGALQRTTGALKELTLEEAKRKRYEETGINEPGFGYKSPWGPTGLGGSVPNYGQQEVERFGGRYVIDAMGNVVAELERKYGAGGFLGYGYRSKADEQRAMNQIIINGSVLGNKEEIARVVGDAIAGAYRGGGNRLPV
jgi:hypothetical protein